MPSVGASLESIAPDVHFLVFPVTDGDQSRRPENTQPPPHSAREVNWNRPMTLDERFACRWRNLIGQGIAKMLLKPGMEKYCLQGFPDGYRMFDHNKGSLANMRHDLYLYGSKTVTKFRSPAEFIPHGYWLLTDPTLNTKNCGCKYCGGGGTRSQTEISNTLGLPTNHGPRAHTVPTRMRVGGVHRPPKPKHKLARPLPPVASSWVPPSLRQDAQTSPAWHTPSLDLSLATSATRISDLRSGRRFRVGELVWCASHPAAGEPPRWRDAVGDPAPFWPAMVVDFSLATVVRHRVGCVGGGDGLPFSVLQTRRYSLLRLGALSEDVYAQFEGTVDEDEILPWHAHRADACSQVFLHPDNVSYDQVDALTWALQIAQRVTKVWAVCGRLPIQIPAPPVHVQNDVVSVPPRLGYDTGLVPRSPARLKPPSQKPKSSATTPGPTSQPPGSPQVNTVTETQYEGLWYGAERIWVGDVVRLCPERDAFNASLRLSDDESFRQHRQSTPEGAGTGCVLMRVDRVFTRLGESGTKECAVAGPLYELDATEATLDTSTSESRCSSRSDKVIAPWDVSHTPPPPARPSDRGLMSDLASVPLPPAPEGYALHALLQPGLELALPVAFIAGRYYPDLLEWPMLARETKEPHGIELRALCGLAAGRFNHPVCEDVRLDSRTGMVREATHLAKVEIEKLLRVEVVYMEL